MKKFDFARRAKRDLGFLIEKEFKQFFRNSFLPKMLVGFPIAAILVIPWVANMEIKNINLSIVDFDKSTLSNELIAKIEAGGLLQNCAKRAFI